MTAGYYLSTPRSQHSHQIFLVCSRKTQKKPNGISVILESFQSAAYHNSSIYPFLFIQRISITCNMVWYLVNEGNGFGCRRAYLD